ncbi:MAG: 3-oxoacyl-[acyl-carrier-protein] synthase 3 [Bryobacteraceae bacterium]|nr:MAG: 3-oxoacyl-[acyl-carrier-protein] synthase 3 [Bryobacteraceae bacterium]
MLKAKISAVGAWVPPRVLTNDDLARMVETSNEWILERTGIRERHIADPDIATSDMAIEAARAALANRGTTAEDVDAIILCTVTPDHMFPSTACIVQHKLGVRRAWGFDLVAACSSFVYGLTVAAHLVGAGTHRKVLVIGSDTMSRIIDYTDRTTCVLFGDGAGAFLIEPAREGEEGFLGFRNEIDGSGGDMLIMPAGGSRMPPSHETVEKRLHFVHQEGQAVFKYAVKKMGDISAELLEQVGIAPSDVKLMIPHQANRRIILAAANRLGIPEENVLINIDRFGNTTSGTIPIATTEAWQQGRLKKGDIVLFAAVGAGFTVGANVWRWAF